MSESYKTCHNATVTKNLMEAQRFSELIGGMERGIISPDEPFGDKGMTLGEAALSGWLDAAKEGKDASTVVKSMRDMEELGARWSKEFVAGTLMGGICRCVKQEDIGYAISESLKSPAITSPAGQSGALVIDTLATHCKKWTPEEMCEVIQACDNGGLSVTGLSTQGQTLLDAITHQGSEQQANAVAGLVASPQVGIKLPGSRAEYEEVHKPKLPAICLGDR
jgi:hypothetical protein